jgi:uncharacterized protein
MAVTGLLALLDDVTTILDDVAALSKVAAQKTAGIAGDDLAVNAQGLVGLEPSRELPIVGKVALGSLANKAVLVPLALALPHAWITPLLMIGGTFLCYEGFHKVTHRKHDPESEAHHARLVEAVKTGPEALADVERQKVRQAIITDVILSAEIVAVALGAVAEEPFASKALVLSLVSVGMTVAIYGLVATIVKLDDVGLSLQRRRGAAATVGRLLVDYTPTLMKVISVVGTAAMFLVGGGIFLHGVPAIAEPLHHFVEGLSHSGFVQGVANAVTGVLAGLVLGAVAALVVDQGVLRAVRAVRGTG